MKKLIIGKKGATMGGWVEGIIMVSIFLLLLSGVVAGLNSWYSIGPDIDIGLIDDFNVSGVQEQTVIYQESSQGTLNEAEVESASDGLNFIEAWSLANSARKMVWNIVTGGWIHTILVDYLQLGDTGRIIAYFIQALWIIGIVFGIIKLFMKVKP